MASADVNRLALRDLDRVTEPAPAAAATATAPGTVGPGSRITLHFSLRLNQGDVIDSNFDKPPVSCVIGDGSMLPGFEQTLLGLKEGESVEVLVPAAQAFGEINPDNQQRFPRFHFPPDLALTENLMIEFADASGYKQAGRVVSISARDVEIDFNHPLAGRDILFNATVYRIEDVAQAAAPVRSSEP